MLLVIAPQDRINVFDVNNVAEVRAALVPAVFNSTRLEERRYRKEESGAGFKCRHGDIFVHKTASQHGGCAEDV